MNCFYHQTVPAVGTCKSCGKGLCPQCALDFGTGLACRGRCEEQAKAISDLISQNVAQASVSKQILASAWKNRFLNAAFYLVFGFMFAGFGVYRFAISGFEEPVVFFGFMGVGFLVFGFIILWRVLNMPRPQK
ncbi:MAG TPA: hypothetical protein VHY09_07870 [Candidatus Methylacidiphilales bacterium]|nr:hypothetical protein [Candidatus Methylacidiphilales bacterium]